MDKFYSNYIFSNDSISDYYRNLLGIKKDSTIKFSQFIKLMTKKFNINNIIISQSGVASFGDVYTEDCKYIYFSDKLTLLRCSNSAYRAYSSISAILKAKNSSKFCLFYDKNTQRLVVNQTEFNHETFIKIHKKVLTFLFTISNNADILTVKKEVSKIKYCHKKMTATIGIDGELELVVDSSVYRASRYISDYNNNKKIGVDGSGDPMELRPSPSINTKTLVKSVSKLINEFGYGMSARGDSFPIGCHIHLSIKENKMFDTAFSKDRKILYKKVLITKYLTKLFDFYLGKHLICLNGRQRGSYYGKLGDIRKQFHGGIEYRTPPSAILADKEFFGIVVEIAKKVFEKYINGNPLDGYLKVNHGKAKHEDYIALGINNISTFFEKINYYKNNRNLLFDIRAAWSTEERDGNS